ncbi:MAG: hypothetical protein LBD64_07265, partial [Odoribacteraceae bacterium]|nr:hypothetical protein [Odoribacteraceae bacterium]
YAYSYEENEKWYVNINGMVSKGHYGVRVYFTKSGKYAYSYEENEKWYVNINGTVSKGYDEVVDFYFTESGKYAYFYRENEELYVNSNNVEFRSESLPSLWINYDKKIELYSTDRAHSFSSSPEYGNIVIDGKRYGHSPAINAYYDRARQTVIWGALEGKELVEYRYTWKD